MNDGWCDSWLVEVQFIHYLAVFFRFVTRPGENKLKKCRTAHDSRQSRSPRLLDWTRLQVSDKVVSAQSASRVFAASLSGSPSLKVSKSSAAPVSVRRTSPSLRRSRLTVSRQSRSPRLRHSRLQVSGAEMVFEFQSIVSPPFARLMESESAIMLLLD